MSEWRDKYMKWVKDKWRRAYPEHHALEKDEEGNEICPCCSGTLDFNAGTSGCCHECGEVYHE